MEIPEGSYRQQSTLLLLAVVYHAVMLAAFVIGMYGLFSLFSLASAELQQSVHIVSLP